MNKEQIIVIHIFASLNAGGAESRILDVYRKIDRNRVQFHFISLDTQSHQFYEEEILSLGGKIYKIPSPREIGFVKHFRQLKSIFKHYFVNNAVVHSHTLHHSGLVLLAARASGLKTRIAHARSTSSRHKGFVSRMFVNIGRILINMNATYRLGVVSEANAFLYGKRNINKPNTLVIPNAIDLESYMTVAEEEIKSLKEEYNLLNAKYIIGHVGRFETMKNHTFLIKVFDSFLKENKDSVLVLIGSGRLKNETEELVRKLGLSDHIRFLGTRRDINKWMNIFDLVVVPSLFEGMCGVVLESQAAGTPCLCSVNVPNPVDMNLGIVRFIELSQPLQFWVENMEELLKINKVPNNKIVARFQERKFSLDEEITTLYRLYGVN